MRTVASLDIETHSFDNDQPRVLVYEDNLPDPFAGLNRKERRKLASRLRRRAKSLT